MKSPYQTLFSNAVLTSVFVGIFTTLLCMAYYLGFKEVTGYPLSSLVNVSSLIFVINILFLVIGFIYFLFLKVLKIGEMAFIMLFVLLTIFSMWEATNIHRVDDHLINIQFHQLLKGIFLIIGVGAFAGIPFLFHNRTFNDKVL